MIYLVGISLVVIALAAFAVKAFTAGKKESDAEKAKELIDDVYTAKKARDIINLDPALRRRLRDKYTRS